LHKLFSIYLIKHIHKLFYLQLRFFYVKKYVEKCYCIEKKQYPIRGEASQIDNKLYFIFFYAMKNKFKYFYIFDVN